MWGHTLWKMFRNRSLTSRDPPENRALGIIALCNVVADVRVSQAQAYIME